MSEKRINNKLKATKVQPQRIFVSYLQVADSAE
jgi:hypothetical protein